MLGIETGVKNPIKTILAQRQKRSFWGFWFLLFLSQFISGVFLQKTPAGIAAISAMIGSLIGALIFYFLMKKWFGYMGNKVEKGFANIEIPDKKYETYAEIGSNFFTRKAGKIYVTDEKLIFKPSVFNKSTQQPFQELILSDIKSLRKKKDFLGRDQVIIFTEEKQFVINPFQNDGELATHLKASE